VSDQTTDTNIEAMNSGAPCTLRRRQAPAANAAERVAAAVGSHT